MGGREKKGGQPKLAPLMLNVDQTLVDTVARNLQRIIIGLARLGR